MTEYRCSCHRPCSVRLGIQRHNGEWIVYIVDADDGGERSVVLTSEQVKSLKDDLS